MNTSDHTLALRAQLGVALPQWVSATGQPAITAHSPIDGSPIVSLHCDSVANVHAKIGQAQHATLQSRSVPAPR